MFIAGFLFSLHLKTCYVCLFFFHGVLQKYYLKKVCILIIKKSIIEVQSLGVLVQSYGR